ncbi:MAG TPA: alpha-E domain-containing protein, partial [Thermoanaerobaculia bacterium]|nr:alpha-E domain-containing protein [Thermoanaerobaculia bacterium]
ERADNTARILDVKYHVLLPERERVGGPLDYFQWASILRSVSALTSFHWVYRQSVQPGLVADLLILNRQMPRSLVSCYLSISRNLDALADFYRRQGRAQRRARALLAERAFALELGYRIEHGEPYFHDLRERWSEALRAAHIAIPRPPYGEAT